MDDHSDPVGSDDWLRDLPLRSEEIGFSPDEMIACTTCRRANAPNRTTCMYCGAGFAAGKIQEKTDIRKLEIWEKGFNVVITNANTADADTAAFSLASLTSIEPSTLKPILTSGTSLPVARVETEEQAALISEKLATIGIATMIVSDESLSTSLPQVRLRSISFERDELVLTLFNSGDLIRLHRDDLVLMVTSVLLESRTEAFEKRKRGSSETINETQTSSDVPIIDIYSKNDPRGWRITAHGFDFSCLGEEKSLLVAENMQRLTGRLTKFTPAAKLVDDYTRHCALLEHCWPVESRKEAHGFQHSGFAQRGLSSVSTTNNAIQLMKYSRLQWHLL